MNCQEAIAKAYDYFERKLDPAAREAVDAHVAGCQGCGELWIKARETNCHELTDTAGEYVDGALDAARLNIFERHLTICRACVAYLASYRRTIEMAKASASVDASALRAMEERLLAALLEARRGQG